VFSDKGYEVKASKLYVKYFRPTFLRELVTDLSTVGLHTLLPP
jgi:hypothetical protein